MLIFVLITNSLEIIDIFTNDLPRDLTEKRMELEKIQAYKAIIRLKDVLIVKLNELRYEKMKKRKENLGKEAINMVNIATKSLFFLKNYKF